MSLGAQIRVNINVLNTYFSCGNRSLALYIVINHATLLNTMRHIIIFMSDTSLLSQVFRHALHILYNINTSR